ncbi:MAG: pilus assembly PilX N-terminal domain-containing protein [Thermoleophilia bacterium]|nr:pilus assembly PilX N-terminal domain-containing protein [Thermoleophilia bacterium]
MGPFIRLGKDERGAALIIAMAILSVMMIIGITTVSMSLNSEKTVGHDQKITMAQNVAEAGVDDVIAVTMANFASIYPNGNYPTMATHFYDSVQEFTDESQNVLGNYEVWTQRDPDRPGNLLITSIGRDSSGSSRTVKVSINYDPNYFNYVLLPGKQTATTTATFKARSSSWDGHHGEEHHESGGYASANISMTGNIGVNGNMVFDSSQNGSDWGDDDDDDDHDHNYYESPGTVTFLARDGYPDTVTYTGSKSGTSPLGLQPFRSGFVAFPTASLTTQSGSSVALINFPSCSGSSCNSYVGVWTRDSYNKIWKISAQNFQNTYGTKTAVKMRTTQSGYTLQIEGSCGATEITPTIWTEGNNGGNSNFTKINLVGPGIRLNPTTGIALIADRGAVTISNEAFIGSQGHGALVYLSGKNGTTSFTVTGNLSMWGSIVVNGATTFDAQGTGIHYHDHEDDDEHDRNHSSGSCTGDYSHDHENDDWHNDNHHRSYSSNIRVVFDGAYLANPALTWTWTGGAGLEAVKENYEVE